MLLLLDLYHISHSENYLMYNKSWQDILLSFFLLQILANSKAYFDNENKIFWFMSKDKSRFEKD